LARDGQNAAALPELQSAVQTAGTPEEKIRASQSLAVAYLDLGNNQAAAQTFSLLLALEPDSVAGLAGRGQAEFNLQRFEAAGTDFVAAGKKQQAPQLFHMAADSFVRAGKTEAARDAMEIAISLSKNHTNR
jgi:tetratricopeptide (TPR) repeat protein